MNNTEKPFAGFALLTDLDGTLLTPDKKLLPEDAAAIAGFRADGGLFSLATGRGFEASKAYIDLFQPDYPAVLYNGAVLYDGRTQQRTALGCLPKGIRALLEELAAAFPDAGAEVLNQDGVFVFQDGEYERLHLNLTNVPVILKSLDEIDPEQCYKSLFAGAPEVLARILEYVRKPQFSELKIVQSHDFLLEILPADVSKGHALQTLRGMLPAGTKIGATGDFDNDIEMLLAADDCGCPADAAETVREAVRCRGGFVSEKTCADGFFADWIRFLRCREKNACTFDGFVVY